MDLDGPLGDRALGVDVGLERLPVDVDQAERVLRRGLRLRHDRGDSRARERDAVDLERAGHGDEVLDAARLPRARQRREVLEVLAREDGDHARVRGRTRRVDPVDPRVRVRRAQDRDVRHPRQLEVVQVAGRAGDQARVLDALDRGPEDPGRRLGGGGHGYAPPPTPAASRTAATMFS